MGERSLQPRRRLDEEEDRFVEDFDVDAFLPRLGQRPGAVRDEVPAEPAELTEEERLRAALRNRPPRRRLFAEERQATAELALEAGAAPATPSPRGTLFAEERAATDELAREQERARIEAGGLPTTPSPRGDLFAEPRERFEAGLTAGPSEFGSLAEYEAFRRAEAPAPEPEPVVEPERRGPITTGVTTRVLYSWRDPETGTLEFTDDPTKVPPDVAADVFRHQPPAEREPREAPTTGTLFSFRDPDTDAVTITDDPDTIPEGVTVQVQRPRERPAPEPVVEPGPPVVLPSAVAGRAPEVIPTRLAGEPERPGELRAAAGALGEAARVGAAGLTETFQQREAQAVGAQIPSARELGARNAEKLDKAVPKGLSFTEMMFAAGPGAVGGTAAGLPRMDPETADFFAKAMINVSGESEIAGKVSIPLAIETDLEANINALPKQTFLQTMSDAWARRKTEDPGALSSAAAWADMFGDTMSLGGTQQLEFDYSRKLVLADPEVIAFAQSQGLSGNDLTELIFPEGESYSVRASLLKEGRWPIVRRTVDGFVQDHWRAAAKERPELVNAIVRKTRGALESGLAWEHFMEQGILKGLGEAFATDPMLIGELVLAAVTGGVGAGAIVLSKTGALRAAAKLQKAAGLTRQARVVFTPLETAIGVTARKVVAPGVAIVKPRVRRIVAKALPGVAPGAEFGIRRALWRGWETKGGKGRRLVARLTTLFSDSDLVLAHKNQIVKGMNESLSKLGVADDVLVREGARIEAVAAAAQKLQRRKPLLFNKGQVDAERMFKGLDGKTVLDKNGELTPLGRVVNWLDTGKGEAALTPAERKIADTLRKRFDDLKAQLPEGVGKVDHYFPRFKPIGKGVDPTLKVKKAIGTEGSRFWEEIRKAEETAIRLYASRDDITNAVAKRLAGQEVAALDETVNKSLRTLAESLDGAAPTKKLKGFEVPKTVDISGKPVSVAEAKRIARIQRAKKTKAGLAAADRIEARIADIEAIPAKVISPVLKKAAPAKIRELRPEVNLLKKQLGAADVAVRGLQKPLRRAERGKARIARLADEKKELQRGIRQMAEGTAKVKREEALSLVESRLKKAQTEAAALVPSEKDIQRFARVLHKRAKERGKEFSVLQAVKDEFRGPIRIAKPLHPGSEMEAWKKLPLAWRAKAGQGRPIDTLMQEILDNNPGLRGEYGAIPDPTRFVEDMKLESAGKSRRRVSDFEQAAEEELLWGVEVDEAKVLSKIDDLTAERESLLQQALAKQADDTLEEAEKARWIEAAQKKIEKLDLQHAKIQTALPPARELEQLAKRLDISYGNRQKLAKDLAAKKRKMREYWDFTKAKKPIYVEKPVDVGTEFVEMMRKYPVVRTDLEELEKFHRKWILRPFKTTMLGYRPSYAGRNMVTASARTINEMINGFMEGKPWAPSWNKVARDYMHMDSEFLFESMYARHIPITTKKTMGRIPHFVYTMEGTSDRFFKTGATVGKVRGEVARLARLNEVPTTGKAFPEIVEQLQAKGVITDFADLVRKEGVDEANRIFFNFQERIGLMIGVPGEAFPFAEWGYKNFSYVLRDLTKHPWKLRAWKIGYDQWTAQYQEHPEFARHVVRLTKDSPLKYFNNWFMQPLWSVGGYQPLQPFLEGTSEYGMRRMKTFEPMLDSVLAREKSESLTWNEREKLIDKMSSAGLSRGVGSFRHYLDQNYVTGPQSGYRHNKHALKEIIGYAGSNLSLGPTAQMAMARVGLAKFQGGNRQWLGWQNVVEDLGLAISGTNLMNLAGENRGNFYQRKVRQEMDRQQIRGELRNLRKAEKTVGIQNAIIHTVNNLVPISARFIPPEEVERLAGAELRQRVATGGLAVSETPPPDVMKRQFETGEDYPVAKFGVEATRAVKKNDYSRVREVVAGTGGVAALVPLRLSTQSEEIEAKRVAASVEAIGTLPESERAQAADAYGVGAMILADTAAPARKRVETGYYDRAAAFVVLPGTKQLEETDPEMQALLFGVTAIGHEKTSQLARNFIEKLAADAISTGDRELFERVLSEHPDMVEFAGRLEPDLITKQRALVMKGARLAPDKVRANVKKVADLARSGMSAELISFTDSLSSSEVTAIKDEIGAGRYKELLDDAKEIGTFNEASDLLQGVFASDDVPRAWEDLNNKQQRQIDHAFPELDMPELITENKKREKEREETEDWKRRIADSNYDVRMRRVVPVGVKRRLGDEHQFWFDFFNPSERELAQKERVKVLQAERKEQEKRFEKEKEFRAEVEEWRKKIEESEFDNSFRGSRVPMKVKRRLAEKSKKFEAFFFRAPQATRRGGRRTSQATAKARPGVSVGGRFRPAQTRAERRRRTQVPIARGRGGGGFEQAKGKAGKPT